MSQYQLKNVADYPWWRRLQWRLRWWWITHTVGVTTVSCYIGTLEAGEEASIDLVTGEVTKGPAERQTQTPCP